MHGSVTHVIVICQLNTNLVGPGVVFRFRNTFVLVSLFHESKSIENPSKNQQQTGRAWFVPEGVLEYLKVVGHRPQDLFLLSPANQTCNFDPTLSNQTGAIWLPVTHYTLDFPLCFEFQITCKSKPEHFKVTQLQSQ